MSEATYYNAFVRSIEIGESKNGHEQFAIRFELANNGEGTGEFGTAFLYMSGGAREYTIEKLKRIGFDGNIDNPGFTDELIEVSAKTEFYDGKDRVKWDIAGGTASKPLANDKQRRLRSEMSAIFGGKSSAPASSPPKKGPPPPSSSAPDEVDYSGVTDRESAWAKLTEMIPDEEKAGQAWIKEIESIGKAEEDFTEKDWQKVASAGIPF